MGGKPFEKPVNLKPYKPASEAPTVEAQPTQDYPRLVEKVKAAPRSRPKLIDQLKAQQPGPDEDLTPLLEKSLEEVLKRKR